MIQWNELCYELLEDSKVKGKTGYGVVPGTIIDGKLHRASLQAWGWTGVISADSRNKEAAYQFLRYVTSPQIMANVFHRGYFGYEPWRESEFTNPRLIGFTAASPMWLKAIGDNMAVGVPDLHIPGGFGYYDVLAIEVGEVLAGKKSAKEGLDAAAKEWNKITKKRGIKAQKEAYREMLGL
jgi:multiple sugar transport system substrate-binding protein